MTDLVINADSHWEDTDTGKRTSFVTIQLDNDREIVTGSHVVVIPVEDDDPDHPLEHALCSLVHRVDELRGVLDKIVELAREYANDYETTFGLGGEVCDLLENKGML